MEKCYSRSPRFETYLDSSLCSSHPSSSRWPSLSLSELLLCVPDHITCVTLEGKLHSCGPLMSWPVFLEPISIPGGALYTMRTLQWCDLDPKHWSFRCNSPFGTWQRTCLAFLFTMVMIIVWDLPLIMALSSRLLVLQLTLLQKLFSF